MLKRAAVLIGVKKTGGSLPELYAVGSGIQMMAAWALSQRSSGMQEVIVLSDANDQHGEATLSGARQEVRAFDVKQVITQLVDSGLEQLIVYFAGHGANVRYNELWLLSRAPEDANDAVNVKGSIEIAKRCGVPHIIFIADACRTAAATLQAQVVEGSLVFPSYPAPRKQSKVDVFYATVVGRPALELKDPVIAQQKFVAVYTKSLADGLNGGAPLEKVIDGKRDVQVIRSWPLQRYLERTVPEELMRLNAPITLEQAPDAEIMSPPECWVSQPNVEPCHVEFPQDPKPDAEALPSYEGGTGRFEQFRKRQSSNRNDSLTALGHRKKKSRPQANLPTPIVIPLSHRDEAISLRSRAQDLIADALYKNTRRTISHQPPAAKALSYIAQRHGQGRQYFPMVERLGCAFVTHGSFIADVCTADSKYERLESHIVFVPAVLNVPSSALVVSENGYGALLPVIPNYVATLSFEERELIDVTYELVDGKESGDDIEYRIKALAPLRLAAAEASRMGVANADLRHRSNVDAIADRLAAAEWLDISLDLYSAYIFAAAGRSDLIDVMQSALLKRLGIELFDIALLRREPNTNFQLMNSNVYPGVPLLTKGWALLQALGVSFPPSLRGLAASVTNSPWTLFNQRGVEMLRMAIINREIR